MTSRHAAALVLVGWYLMTPTIYSDPEGNWMMGIWERRQGQPAQPDLSSWEVRGSYKTAAECHAAVGTLAHQPTTSSEILADPLIVKDPEGYRAIRNEITVRARLAIVDFWSRRGAGRNRPISQELRGRHKP
jgi:hypothetical protein